MEKLTRESLCLAPPSAYKPIVAPPENSPLLLVFVVILVALALAMVALGAFAEYIPAWLGHVIAQMWRT